MDTPLHHDPEEHDTYEEGIHLDAHDKMVLFGIGLGLAFLMFLVLVGIGF